jgi:hypothetical protein
VVFVGKSKDDHNGSSKDDRNGSAPKAARKAVKPGSEDQATLDEFEREGMGVAAKE